MQLLGQNEVDCRQKQVVILSQDSFYRVLTSEQKAKALKGQFNFDHPGESGLEGVCVCVCVLVDRGSSLTPRNLFSINKKWKINKYLRAYGGA